MEKFNIGLIGLGAIGSPIADKLFSKYGNDFCLIASGERYERFVSDKLFINDRPFTPKMISSRKELDDELSLIIVCIKNYDLESALEDICAVISTNTIILPLQNGLFARDFFRKRFPENCILSGFIQGPNTERFGNQIVYQNGGTIHIGCPTNNAEATKVYNHLLNADIDIILENDIEKSVWKKWMLNVAGNSITALTGADYSMFKKYKELQHICTEAMKEFLEIAHAENVRLTTDDINDILNYYINYNGEKKTSMLVDMTNERRTENEFLSGKAIELATIRNISVPIITTLFYLIRTKESIYMNEKQSAINALLKNDYLYDRVLMDNIKDIHLVLQSKATLLDFTTPQLDKLSSILNWTVNNSDFYKYLSFKENLNLYDFPVMNKNIMKSNYNSLKTAFYENKKTHLMHTSGSTGTPFTVIQNIEKRQRHIADLKYFGALADYKDGDPMCYLRAKPTATKEEQERDKIWQLDISNLNRDTLISYYSIILEKGCVALIAYPSTLETAVSIWSKEFIDQSNVRTIITTSEMLTEELKTKIKNFFRKPVNIYARYSNTENGILGQETDETGRFALNWASYYFEILKLDRDEPAEQGELGRVVITDLYNKAFPMIRYDTGDLAKLNFYKDKLPELSELYGRKMDLIYDVYGEAVSPFLLARTMRLSNSIEQWQFMQTGSKNYILKITSNLDIKPTCTSEIFGFKQVLGENAIIDVNYVEEIPIMSSLKRKLIVQEYYKEK
jgi:phenylacetate-CoA ligase